MIKFQNGQSNWDINYLFGCERPSKKQIPHVNLIFFLPPSLLHCILLFLLSISSSFIHYILSSLLNSTLDWTRLTSLQPDLTLCLLQSLLYFSMHTAMFLYNCPVLTLSPHATFPSFAALCFADAHAQWATAGGKWGKKGQTPAPQPLSPWTQRQTDG